MKGWGSRIIAVVLTGWALTACSAANPVINVAESGLQLGQFQAHSRQWSRLRNQRPT